MEKRLALLSIGLLFALALAPAYCLSDEDALAGSSALLEIHGHLLAAITSVFYFHDTLQWTGLSLLPEHSGRLPLYLPFAPDTRAPPA